MKDVESYCNAFKILVDCKKDEMFLKKEKSYEKEKEKKRWNVLELSQVNNAGIGGTIVDPEAFKAAAAAGLDTVSWNNTLSFSWLEHKSFSLVTEKQPYIID